MLISRGSLLGLKIISSVFEIFNEILLALSRFVRFLGQYLRVRLIFSEVY